jgi:hypothetical protein
MWRRDPADAVRFFVGLLAGMLASGMVLALLTNTVGRLVHLSVGHDVRMLMLAAVILVFAGADLANRTPHIWRQVPQSLIWRLKSGTRGLVWGFDLGLLVTTQKVVSLMWLAIAGVVLVAPDAAGLVFVAMAVVSCLAIAVLSLTEVAMSESFCGIHDRRWLKRIRLVSGAVAVVVAGVILV